VDTKGNVRVVLACRWSVIEIEGFADALQKAAGVLFSAFHVVPRTVVEPGSGVNERDRDLSGVKDACIVL
jgi:hypothetical protein